MPVEFTADGSGCHYCAMARERWDWPMYFRTCRGCAIRALANSFDFFDSRKAGRMLPAYQQSLRANFGDAWQTAHEEVKAEYERVQALRETANV
ncbi:MAG: hypothetical protein KGI52_09405 [Burkholderiales bacterium]|nr:hypothetical protein [Burkholderiales bacterium]